MVNLLRHRFGVLEKIGVIKMSFNDRRIQEPASRIEVAGLSDYPLGEIFAAYEDLMIVMLDHYS